MGSHAISRPKGLLLGGSAFMYMAVFQPMLECAAPGSAVFRFQSLLSIMFSGTCCAGMYASPVCGLKDMECQLCAPYGPGMASYALSLERASATSIGRPFSS